MLWVEVDRSKCIGCLACTRCNNFICGYDFKAHAVRSAISEVDCNQEAADLCPVGAIVVAVNHPNLSKSS